jgi:superkiller protein 3
VTIHRQLTKTNPAYLGDLATSLSNLGVLYTDLGRNQEALVQDEEAVKIRRQLAKTNPAYLGDLATSLNNLGVSYINIGQPEIARKAYEESIATLRALAATNPAFQDSLQRAKNNLEELNRREGIRTGATQVLGVADTSYLPRNDPISSVKRAVVLLWPTFSGQKSGVGLLGTGFVVRRQGDRAWIATALHVVRDPEHYQLATKVEAQLFTGPLPPGLVPPRLEVVLNPSTLPASGDEPILLEVRGLPPDVQPLPLAKTAPQGLLMIVGHPTGSDPWRVERFPLLKEASNLVLDGRLTEGASGSPVVTPAGQVVGLVYRSSGEGEPEPFVYAFPARLIQVKLP